MNVSLHNWRPGRAKLPCHGRHAKKSAAHAVHHSAGMQAGVFLQLDLLAKCSFRKNTPADAACCEDTVLLHMLMRASVRRHPAGLLPCYKATSGGGGQSAVGMYLQRQLEAVQRFAEHRGAQVAAAMLHDEGQLCGRRVLRRHDQVALILTVLVVEHDNEITGAQLGHRLYGQQQSCRSADVIRPCPLVLAHVEGEFIKARLHQSDAASTPVRILGTVNSGFDRYGSLRTTSSSLNRRASLLYVL